ncbi:MAG: hypothetical protein WBQ27_06885 [Thermoanaerobaculia bacterium]
MPISSSFRWILVLSVMVLVAHPTVVHAETNLNFVLGEKLLDSDDWPVGDSQGMLAFLSTFGPSSWPVQVAIDVVGSGSAQGSFFASRPEIEFHGEDIVQSTFELDVGVRKIWRLDRARPFVGGGLAVIWGRQDRAIFQPPRFDPDGHWIYPELSVIVSEEDEAPGVWVDGGIFWRMGNRFNLGLEARFSRAELGFATRDVQAGGFSLGLILGWGWGGGPRIVR